MSEPSGDFASNVNVNTTPSPHSFRGSPTLVENLRALRENSFSKPTAPSQETRGHRSRPIPSPLQQSALNSRPSTGSQRSPTSPLHSLPSPRERLDALLASENEVLSSFPLSQGKASPESQADTPNGLTNAQSRNFSAPAITSSGQSSPPVMAVPSRPHPRPQGGRNASIDSVSTISSNASQPVRSGTSMSLKSLDGPGSGPTTLDGYIASAGGLETAVQRLWKDKQQNDQLWRLIEKQRGMLMAASTNMDRLSKDLERVQKSKDRYKRKFEEQVAANEAIRSNGSSLANALMDRGMSNSPAVSEPQEQQMANRGVKSDGHDTAQQAKGPESAPTTSASSPVKPSDSASQAASVNNSTADEKSPTEIKSALDIPSPLRIGGPTSVANSDVSRQDSALKDQISPKSAPMQPLAVRRHAKTPSLTLTQPSPVVNQGAFPSPEQIRGINGNGNTNRKAPPAALNLQGGHVSAHLHQAVAGEHSDSEYDDTLEVNELPEFDRGRRKTREADDAYREAVALRQSQTRSQAKDGKSKSKSKSKSKAAAEPPVVSDEDKAHIPAPATVAVAPPAFIVSGLPSSPRMANAAGSINALLSPTNSESSMHTQRSIMSPPLMSPGLPMSPRPGLHSPTPRLPRSPMASPPMSPRTGLPLSPRAPRQPIPLPSQNNPLALISPHLARAEAYQPALEKAAIEQRTKSSEASTPASEKGNSSPKSDSWSETNVYEGFMSDQYPGFLITPNALPVIHVRVFSSRMRPSRHSMFVPNPPEEDPVFQLGIYARSDNKQLWRVEKTFGTLPTLQSYIQKFVEFDGKLPEKQLFSGHAPAKIDARRAALNTYFEGLLDTPLNEPAAHVVCKFFSTDVIGASEDDAPSPINTDVAKTGKTKPHKTGYLTKRGQKFGGWKARYFILDGPDFKYYETPGGAHIGTIKLSHAQIGRQSNSRQSPSPSRRTEDSDNEFRHAFLILEPKAKDPANKLRHILCAESDEERDAWVTALMAHVDDGTEQQPPSAEAAKEPGSARSFVFPNGLSDKQAQPKSKSRIEQLQAVGYEDTVAAEAPVRGPVSYDKLLPLSPPHTATESPAHPSISRPTGGAVIYDASQWGNQKPSAIKDKKRSIFGFRGRSSSDLVPDNKRGPSPQPSMLSRQNEARAVFGIPLAEAVECSRPEVADVPLPAVVYRSLEYLRARDAKNEEGIFRLSGSQNVIKILKDRFNNEGDVDLVNEPMHYDIHAVASLLKAYLRELPASILTRDLHLDFLTVTEHKGSHAEKVSMLNVLAHRLPKANFHLLNALIGYLVEITDNADWNKMNVRNLSIVFAPTLNIQGPLIIAFLSDHASIFGAPVDEASSPIREVVVSAPLTPEAIRSPRHQMFSDLPTPAYNQTGFSHVPFHQPQQTAQSLRGPPQNDTGFIPLKPSYEPSTTQVQVPSFNQFQQQVQQSTEGYGSLNSALAPSNSNTRAAKAKKRESGMLLMSFGLGHGDRRPSMQSLRENSKELVQEDSAF